MVTARYGNLTSFFLIILGFAFPHTFSAQEKCMGENIFISKRCVGDDLVPIEQELFMAVNKYRVENGQPALKLSLQLTMLGNRRLLDLNQNLKTITHSWSNCPYNITDEKTWPCLTASPQRLNSGYKGEGYETLYRTSGRATVSGAIEAWKKSSLHSSIILNQGAFAKLPWDAVGVAVNGQYAVLWFGFTSPMAITSSKNVIGLGISFDQAIDGLSRMLSIEQKSSERGGSLWQGFSRDKKLKLEIQGTEKEISEASIGITVQLSAAGKLDFDKRTILSVLLKNIFPEWPDIDIWLENSLNLIAQNRTARRTKVVRKNLVELRSLQEGTISLNIRPQSRPQAIEIF